MALERHATDVAGDELVALFSRASRNLEAIVRDGLRRGLDPNRAHTPDAVRGDATLRYRALQMVRARGILADLERQAKAASPRAVRVAYRAAIRTVDDVIGPGLNITGGFGTVHFRAVEALAVNMNTALSRAVATAHDNLQAVFERADAIEGALEVGRSPGPVAFIGRRVNDPYRRVALEQVAQGTIALDTRVQISENLKRQLLNEGITDALTGFVDRAGRRWPLDVYAEMVARTTTREATTRAGVNRMLEGGLGILTISSHPHAADECDPYDGQTFALTSEDAARSNLPTLDVYPPFHPRCLHVATAGTENLDDYERTLARNTAAELGNEDPLLARGRAVAQDLRSEPMRQALRDLTSVRARESARLPRAQGEAMVRRGYAVDARDLGLEEGTYYPTAYAASSRGALDEYVAAGEPSKLDAELAALPEEEAYALWAEREQRRIAREKTGYNAGYRCWECKRFVVGPRVVCPACGYRHGGGNHEAYATR